MRRSFNKNFFITAIFLFMAHSLLAQSDYFWVGGTGDWSDFNNHWATTSGGTIFHSQEPTKDDNVFFDINSFPNGGTITVTTFSPVCNNMDWTGVTTGPQFYSPNNSPFAIYGNLTMADGVYRDVFWFQFFSEDGNTNIIDLADNTSKLNSQVNYDGYMDFIGIGSFELADSVHATALRLYDNTTLSTNGNPIDAQHILITTNAALNAENSNLYTPRFSAEAPFNSSTSTLTFNQDINYLEGSPANLANVILSKGELKVTGSHSIKELTLEPETRLEIASGQTLTVENQMNALGTRSRMIEIRSTIANDPATLALGSSTKLLNFLIVQDNVVTASAGSVFTANSIDNGSNTGWSFGLIPTLDYYWIGGSGKWSDVTHWATTDGGSILRTDPPGPKDNVWFTTSSFPQGGGVNIGVNADVQHLIWTAGSGSTNPSFTSIPNVSLTVRGNFKIDLGVNRNLQNLRFESIFNNEITFGDQGANTSGAIIFDGSGSWSMQDAMSAQQIIIETGTLNTNNNNITALDFSVNGGTINFGTSTLSTRFYFSGAGTANSSTARLSASNGQIYGPISFGNLELSNDVELNGNNTFNNILIEKGADVEFRGGITTFTESLEIQGSRAEMINIIGDVFGTNSTLITANLSASIIINYANIRGITLDNSMPGVDVLATNSLDLGSNCLGIDFITFPLTSTLYFWINGGGNWSDLNHWSSVDGGSPDRTEPPGAIDDVYFTPNSSFQSNDVVTLDIPAFARTMTWQDGSATPLIDDGPDQNPLQLSGSLYMANGVKKSIRNLRFFSSSSDNLIQMADNLGDLSNIDFEGGGSWILLDSIAANLFFVDNGVLKTNNNPVNVVRFFNYAGPQGLELGSSKIYTSSFNGYGATTASNETIYLEDQGELETYGGELNNVIFTGKGYILGTNVVNRLTANQPDSWLWMYGGSVTTVRNELTLTGTAGASLEILSFERTSSGYALNDEVFATFNVPGTGNVIANYIELTGNHALGGADFTANNSVQFNNVNGWNGALLGQKISFNVTDVPFANGPANVDAASDAGLPLTFTIAEGDATISGFQLTPNSPGLVTIEAQQAGNGIYGPAKKTGFIHFNKTDLPNEIGNMKEATIVVGQKDFESNDTFFDKNKTPFARKAFVTPDGKFVTTGSRRALVWNTVPDDFDSPADLVIGQPDFITTGFEINPSTLYASAYGLGMTDDGKLLIADSRGILVWNSFPTQNGQAADYVIGQDDLYSNEHEVTADHFGGTAPFLLISPDQKLIVSDLTSNRILIWNQIPTESGVSADVVIGQPDFTSSESGVGPDKLNFPGYPALTTDGKLVVPDASNNRILVFNSIPTANGASADFVYGQPDFMTNDEGLSATTLDYPYSVDISKSGKLAIADRQNDRVLVFNSFPSNANIPADYVLGQPNFTIEGENQGGVSGRSINDAYGVYWDLSENLYVGDLQNNRFMVWGGPDLEAPTVEGVSLLEPYYTFGGSNQSSVIQVSDRSGINQAKAFWQEISFLNPNSPSYEESDLINLGDGNYAFDLGVIESKVTFPLGVQYFFQFADNLGNILSTEPIKQNLPVYYPSGLPLSTYGIGDETNDYKIIAVPLTMEGTVGEIFSGITGGGYDKTKFRIFEFEGGSSAFTELNSSSDLDIGDAYFALAAPGSASSINLPQGATEYEVNNAGVGQEYRELTLDLKSGWNLIGNPFLHNLNWSDVVTYNNISGGLVGQLQNFANGIYNNTITHIPVGEGAFVFANTDYDLRIPTKRGVGGRIAMPETIMNSLEEENWEVRFYHFNNSGEPTEIGGFGMYVNAQESFDEFDLLNPPTFGTAAKIEFNHPEFFYPSFKKDIQTRKESGQWSFEYLKSAEKPAMETISWDNSYFEDLGPDLYLIDKTHFKVINMKNTDNYSFNHSGNTRFEIYYGEDAMSALMPGSTIIEKAYPNPFNNEVNINIGLPASADKYDVQIGIYDAMGKQVNILNSPSVANGYHNFSWGGLNAEGQEAPKGLYLYRIIISGEVQNTVTGKLIKQ